MQPKADSPSIVFLHGGPLDGLSLVECVARFTRESGVVYDVNGHEYVARDCKAGKLRLVHVKPSIPPPIVVHDDEGPTFVLDLTTPARSHQPPAALMWFGIALAAVSLLLLYGLHLAFR